MGVKFYYDENINQLRWQDELSTRELDGIEVTEQQAMIISASQIAWGLRCISSSIDETTEAIQSHGHETGEIATAIEGLKPSTASLLPVSKVHVSNKRRPGPNRVS